MNEREYLFSDSLTMLEINHVKGNVCSLGYLFFSKSTGIWNLQTKIPFFCQLKKIVLCFFKTFIILFIPLFYIIACKIRLNLTRKCKELFNINKATRLSWDYFLMKFIISMYNHKHSNGLHKNDIHKHAHPQLKNRARHLILHEFFKNVKIQLLFYS